MTKLYNALERVRELDAGIGEPLSTDEQDLYTRGQIRVIAELHDRIDRAVLGAYGWYDLAGALVGKVGGTVPSLHKTEAQEDAEDDMMLRFVALNEARAQEEVRGAIRWLRPSYQVPALGAKAPKPSAEQTEAVLDTVPDAEKPSWPRDPIAQITVLRTTIAGADAPVSPDDLAARFKGGRNRKARIDELLANMVELGIARPADAGARFFIPS